MPPATRSASRAAWPLIAMVLIAMAAMAWWRPTAQARLGEEAARLARPADIRMIASVDCVYCAAASRWFDAHRVPFTACEIERDAACAEAYAAMRSPGTPVILVRSQRLVGFDAAAIVQALRDAPAVAQ